MRLAFDMPPETNPKPNPVDVFRDALEGTIEVARALEPYCTSTADLIGMLELALANQGQLQMVMEKVTQPKVKTR